MHAMNLGRLSMLILVCLCCSWDISPVHSSKFPTTWHELVLKLLAISWTWHWGTACKTLCCILSRSLGRQRYMSCFALLWKVILELPIRVIVQKMNCLLADRPQICSLILNGKEGVRPIHIVCVNREVELYFRPPSVLHKPPQAHRGPV